MKRILDSHPKCVAKMGLLLCASLTGFLTPATGWACPGCKEALFDPGQISQNLATAKGYALSIGLMLAVPLGLALTIALLVMRAHRKQS